jgi:hypothetical protein
MAILFAFAISINIAVVRAPTTGWNVPVTATCIGYSDLSDFGMMSDATAGFDTAYDAVDPPCAPMGVCSWFDYPANPTLFRKLSVSKHLEAPSSTWVLKVLPVSVDGELCLNWDTSELPDDCTASLTDPAGVVVDMEAVSEHCIVVQADTTYTFTIEVSCQPCTEYVLDVSATPGGTTTPAPDAYTYCEGLDACVTAEPDACCTFDHWELDGVDVGNTNPFCISMDGDHTLHAVFVCDCVEIHDVEAVSQTTTPTCPAEIMPGEIVSVEVLVRNNGDFTETFDVTCYYDGCSIGTQAVTLAAGDSTTLTFPWDTTGVPLNGYSISAHADSADAIVEVDEENNWCTVPCTIFVVPEFLFGAILGLLGCFAAFGLFRLSKRINL